MNILLLQLKRIGDLVLTTPAIAAARAKHPRAHISLVVASDSAALLPAIRGVDQTFVARKKLSDARSWITVARRRYEYCLDFTRNDRSSMLTLLSGAKYRVTADHPKLRAKLRSRSYNTLLDCDVVTLHTVDYHLCLLRSLGIEHPSPTLQLHLPESAVARAEETLQARGVTGPFVLLHPGSARAEKFWEPDRWAAIIHFLHGRGLACVVTASASRLEQAHLAAIRAQAKHPFIDLTGAIDLLTLAALIECAQLVVTVDSAPMHFAAASQTPQVVLFGPTNPMHWYPRFTPAIVLAGKEGEPMTRFEEKHGPAPMNRISTGRVIDAMEALLAAPRAATP